MGLLDRQGIDVLVYREEDHSVEIAIQCKGYERPFGYNQIADLLAEVRKFARKGPEVEEYWLVINRPITERSDRNLGETALDDLVRQGKCKATRLLDLDQLTQILHYQAKERIITWIAA